MRRASGWLLAAITMALPAGGYAATQLGWADEFETGVLSCRNTQCSIVGHYVNGIGNNNHTPPRWSFVGKQGANAAGRANARERLMFYYQDSTVTGCSTITGQLARYRTASPPSEGSSCSVTATFVAAKSVTVDSCQFPNVDTYHWDAMLPNFDFSAETAASGSAIGYKSILTYTDSLGGVGSSTQCFKVLWQ